MVANVWISRSINKSMIKNCDSRPPILPWLWFIPLISPLFWMWMYVDEIGFEYTKFGKWLASIEIFDTFKGKNW